MTDEERVEAEGRALHDLLTADARLALATWLRRSPPVRAQIARLALPMTPAATVSPVITPRQRPRDPLGRPRRHL